ncbi:MAG TPA: hypothetical protein VJP06_01580 [Thermoplasmata archaeon]|nr:hypothetical protein [Thermoplasmata archaeon]
MVDVIALVLRFLHISFGIAWIGAIVYGVGVLRRALSRVDAASRKEFMKQLIPVITQFLPGSAVMTILFGFILYLYLGSFDVAYLTGSEWGRILLTALVLALATFAIGMVFGVGSAKKILGHLNEETCTHGPEVGALQTRFNQAQFVGLALGFVIIGLMVAATEGL